MPSEYATSVAPDIGRYRRGQRRRLGDRWALIAVVAAGGALGALARYEVAAALPTPAGGFPWSTLWINLSGCFLIGVLMVLVSEVWSAHRLLRPFLGTGLLGGYTTFSTYAVEARSLLDAGHARLGFGYLAGTVVGALAATFAATLLTRWLTRSRTDSRRRS